MADHVWSSEEIACLAEGPEPSCETSTGSRVEHWREPERAM
jgi:hypothetical protein